MTIAPTPTAPFAGRTIARARGALALGALALCGRGLWTIGETPPVRPEVQLSLEADGSSLRVVAEGRGLGGDPEVRVVLARVPLSFDERKSIAEIGGARRRVIPRGRGTVLVSPEGNVSLEPPLPDALVRELLMVPPPARPALLRRALPRYPAHERVLRFWE